MTHLKQQFHIYEIYERNRMGLVCVCVCVYPAEVFAIKLAGAGEEHGASRHVDPHGERFRGEQSLQGSQGHRVTIRKSK